MPMACTATFSHIIILLSSFICYRSYRHILYMNWFNYSVYLRYTRDIDWPITALNTPAPCVGVSFTKVLLNVPGIEPDSNVITVAASYLKRTKCDTVLNRMHVVALLTITLAHPRITLVRRLPPGSPWARRTLLMSTRFWRLAFGLGIYITTPLSKARVTTWLLP